MRFAKTTLAAITASVVFAGWTFADGAKAIIAKDYPSWEVAVAEFSGEDAQKAVQVPTALFQTYPDLDAVICPDANALHGTAQAAGNLGIAGKVIIAGFSTPNTMRQYVKFGTVKAFGLWDVVVQGKLSVFIANELVKGTVFKVGDKIEVRGIGTIEISPNSVQGYSYEGDGSGIILLPERTVFTAENIDNYDFRSYELRSRRLFARRPSPIAPQKGNHMADLDDIKEGKDFGLDRPADLQGFFLKGAAHHDWGLKNRLSRFFNPKAGRTVMLAFDHGYFRARQPGLNGWT